MRPFKFPLTRGAVLLMVLLTALFFGMPVFATGDPEYDAQILGSLDFLQQAYDTYKANVAALESQRDAAEAERDEAQAEVDVLQAEAVANEAMYEALADAYATFRQAVQLALDQTEQSESTSEPEPEADAQPKDGDGEGADGDKGGGE